MIYITLLINLEINVNIERIWSKRCPCMFIELIFEDLKEIGLIFITLSPAFIVYNMLATVVLPLSLKHLNINKMIQKMLFINQS